MVAAIDRVADDVVQRVVHPAHVPLEAEAKPAVMDRLRHLGIRGRFLGHGHDARHLAIGQAVHVLQHGDGLVILAPAVLVGDPLPVAARIVAVKHRGHRIHAQPVDVIFLEPVKRVRGQEIRHLGAAIVIDQGVPVLMEALARVGMFVKRGAVKAAQPVRVGREMPGHPVQQHAQPRLVRSIDQIAEFMRRPEADRRRKQPYRLITPRPVKGIFADRQQLDMGKAHVAGVIDQFGRGLLVRDRAAAVLPAPASKVDLVDRDRLIGPLRVRAAGHPVRIRPAIARDVAHDRGRLRRMLRTKAHRVGLFVPLAIGAEDLVFIGRALADQRQEDFPDAGGAAPAHDVAPPVPGIEIADDRDAPRIRRPDREMRAAHPFVFDDMRAQHLPQRVMRALAQQIFVHLAQDRAKAIGVLDQPFLAVAAAAQLVRLCPRDLAGKQPRIACDRLQRTGLARDHGGHFGGAGVEGGDVTQPALAMGAEHGEGIVETPLDDAVQDRRVRDFAWIDHGRVTPYDGVRIWLSFTPAGSGFWRSTHPPYSRGWCGRTRTSPNAPRSAPPSAPSPLDRHRRGPPRAARASSR